MNFKPKKVHLLAFYQELSAVSLLNCYGDSSVGSVMLTTDGRQSGVVESHRKD